MNQPLRSVLLAALLGAAAFTTHAADKKIVLVAGTRSHGPGEHEHNAGVQLLAKCLEGYPGLKTVVYLNGWPKETNAFAGADTVLLYMDGGSGHPVLKEDRLAELDALMKKGVGFVAVHYAVEVLKDDVPVARASEPGAIFGDLAALLGGDHTATVRALEPSAFRVVDDPRAFLNASPLVCLHLCALRQKPFAQLNRTRSAQRIRPGFIG